ncbi:hypothetical protein [Modicisalibacter radicis]|uniref:hypothetical protein n=1 Tax=Halomonas sp. EAR18 TaxID=2518972 RepID=UPI00109D0F53|nr:hypothetical protein [Halomonas sp. EAR18]
MQTETAHNDTLLIEKASGERLGPVQGTVDGDTVIVEALHDLAKGDVIVYRQDRGEQRLEVTDPRYHPEVGDVPAHYEARVSRSA